MSNQPSLDEIGVRQNTDKSSIHHDFLHLYHMFFAELRDREMKVLEIGVSAGGSLRMWTEYFSKGEICAIDINAAAKQHQLHRGQVIIADQSKISDLVKIGTSHGPFDIIIDDGSHIWDHQITSLRYLLPFLNPGGYYVVEDLDTSYGTYESAYCGLGRPSAADYLRRMSDYLVGDLALDIEAETDAFLRDYSRRLQFMLFARRTCLIRSKSA